MNFMEAQFSMALAVFLESLSSLQISESSERKREKKKTMRKNRGGLCLDKTTLAANTFILENLYSDPFLLFILTIRL